MHIAHPAARHQSQVTLLTFLNDGSAKWHNRDGAGPAMSSKVRFVRTAEVVA
jgi:hypothetical protein